MSPYQNLRNSPVFADLCRVSARLGRDPLQVQGPGGNASLKDDAAMLVKASGTWLADAETQDIMVPVDLARLREALRTGDPKADNGAAFVPEGENPRGLRPSIETSVHAIFDWPVVLHTHCVATIATALRADAGQVVAERLADLGAAFVPYTKPGLALAQAIDAAADPGTRVLVLGNHGLAAGAETAEEAERLVREVVGRLTPAVCGQEPGTPDLPQSLGDHGWRTFDHGPTTALAFDPEVLGRLRGGSFYPDHVIFLGPGVFVADVEEPAEAALARAAAEPRQNLVVFPGRGVAMPADASPAMQAMARCLGDVAQRLDPEAALTRLTAEDEAELLNWDAEKYRQTLDRSPAAGT
ncbi:class II aldolase/adducin family protein [Pelagibius sp.]|uniref:class II aldolase/adducin family protein n=1 Tax=Pelagibius sp. TaxID=1931238 RepID=UPI00261D0837|nr:class II aldolase/adducin family protein [Pelagibius sp.]